MKKLIFRILILLAFKVNAQELNDRIITKEGDTIVCKITQIEKNSIYYEHFVKNGLRNSYIEKNEVRNFKYNGLYSNEKKAKDTSSQNEYFGEKYIYCEIVGTSKLFSFGTQVTVSIDYGLKRKLFSVNQIKDENGEIQAFNSMIDALNYMGKQGWEFVQAYAITMGNQNVYHYLLKRKN